MSQSKIQINYGSMATVMRRFSEQADEVDLYRKKAEGQIDHLRSGAWQGLGSDAFYKEMDSALLPSLVRLTESLAYAAEQTSVISQKFAAAEEEAAGVGGDGYDGGGGDRRMRGGGETGRDLGEWGHDIFKFGKKAYGWLGTLGKLKVLKADWLDSKAFKRGGKALMVLNGLIDGYGDVSEDGMGVGEAILSEGMDIGLELAYKSLYAVPGLGWGLAAYDGALLVGSGVSMALDAFGMHNEAAWLQNAVKTVDWRTYSELATDQISRWVGDAVESVVDFEAVGNAVEDVGVGFVQGIGSVLGGLF